jgi:signal transduction histidine kinase
MPETRDENELTSEERGLAFFGRISASVSHELNNIMNIMSEKSGLMGDLAYGMENGRDLDPQRLRDMGDSFARQVRRGVDILRRFNRFAHSVDDPSATFELKALVENLGQLAERLANMKKLELKTDFNEDGLNIQGHQFAIQHAVFACLDAAMHELEPGGVITLFVRGSSDEAVVHVSASPAPGRAPGADCIKVLNVIAQTAHCGLDVTQGQDALVFSLRVPRIAF